MDTSHIVTPPPIVTRYEALEQTDSRIPGEIVVDSQGQLLKRFFELEGTVGSLVDQYDNFITNSLPQIIASRSLMTSDGEITFENVFLNRPYTKNISGRPKELLPNMCRDSDYSYLGDVYIELVLNAGTASEERIKDRFGKEKKTFLGRIPVMLGSSLDWLRGKTDQEKEELGEGTGLNSGYFIIKGREKIVLIQEKLRPNRFLVFNRTSKGDVVVKITNNTLLGSTQISMVQGKKSKAFKIHLGFMGRRKGPSNKLGNTISVLQIFRMLGVSDPEEIMAYISLFTKPEYLKRIEVLLQPNFVKLSKVADDFEYLSNKMGLGTIDYTIRKSNIMRDLVDQLFPQVPADEITKKLYMLSMMITRLAEVLIGVRDFDDRDDWGNKQLVTAGKSLELLFASIWREAIVKAQNEIDSKKLNGLQAIARVFENNFITDNFVDSFTANNWGVQSSFMTKDNITDILNRMSIPAMFSHLTKINTPSSRNGKAPKARMVQMSQLGYVDPSETPEGQHCLEVSTPVLMSDGTYKPIGDIVEGDEVITVNPETLERVSSKITQPFRFHTKNTERKSYCLTTVNGKKIRGTGDHLFLTDKGWVALDQLRPGSKVCITYQPKMVSKECISEVILTEDVLTEKLKSVGIKKSIIPKHSKDLKERGFLPLNSEFPKLHLLARIMGFAAADGSLCISNETTNLSLCFGQKKDAQEYLNDLELLGFDKTKIIYRENSMIDKNTGRVTVHKTYVVSKSGSFVSLLLGLGAAYGKKTAKDRSPVPNFVLRGSELVKREYIAGFQGGDGNCMHAIKREGKVKAYNFGFCSEVKQHICEEHSMSLYSYMVQMAKLLQQLDINILSIVKKNDKNDSNMICAYNISTSESNLIKYMDNVGYRYASTKNIKSFPIVEYLRYKNMLIEQRKLIKEKAIQMYKNGSTIKEISVSLQIKYRLAGSIIEYWRLKGDNTQSLPNPKNLVEYSSFQKANKADKSCIFIEVETVEEIEDIEVADFTTLHENHSFVADGFVTHNCGLVKNTAMTAYISLDRSETPVIELIADYVSGSPSSAQPNPFMLNGVFQGWVDGPYVRDLMVDFRRKLVLNKDTAIVLERDGYFNIYTDAARATRPLLVVDTDGDLVISKKDLWNQDFMTLLREGAVEYVDAWEQDSIMLAQSYQDVEFRKRDLEMALQQVKESQDRLAVITNSETAAKLETALSEARAVVEEITSKRGYTHSEMDPTAIFGMAVSIIPLPNTNPGPRLTYQAGMGKQSMGIYHSNHYSRFDTSAKLLAYPSRPIFETQMNEVLGMNELPTGETVIVAVTTYGGFSQEDAIIMAQGAIDRGLFRNVVYKTTKAVAKKKNEKFARPEIDRGKESRYEAIAENGFPKLGSVIKEGDCIIGKVRKNPETGKWENASSYMDLRQEGIVDRILVTTNQEGERVVKVKIRQVRKPQLGDKFACYTPDHEVLTLNRGWVPIAELTLQDLICTLDSGKIVHSHPTEIQTYDYTGQMYRVDHEEVDLCVTPNHRMYVSLDDGEYQIIKAEDIGNRASKYKNMSGEYLAVGQWEEYQGKVHCCTVPSGVIYVRRHGKPVWCGNSRYAQKGTVGMILPDEDMPFTAGGVRPDIIINPHCFVGQTPISTASGLAKPIMEFSEAGGEEVLAWDVEKQRMTVGISAGLQAKGVKKIVELLFEDGRKVKCTPDHRFLTDSHEWVEAKDLQGKKVIAGLEMFLGTSSNGKSLTQEEMRYRQDLSVVQIDDAGEAQTYDIGVHTHHNFLAHGVVAHNCMPSRMTVGKMIEIVTSKLAAFNGESINATAFRNFDTQEFMRNLHQYGYSSSGKERMTSGFTGKPLEAMIFTGPCYYQALKHQVMDKIQMRGRGGINQLTHQPVSGLKRGGGQRVGEMERDAIISHGASAFLRERLCLVSDPYETVYCSTCGTMAITAEDKMICHRCDEKAVFGKCTIPYSFKLLMQLMLGAGISMKFKMQPKQ